MLLSERKSALLAFAQGEHCGRPGYRKMPRPTAKQALIKMGLIGNKSRLTARGWKEVRRYVK